MSKYLIRVEGKLSDELVATFPTLDSSQRPQTILHGALDDPGSLAQVLEHLRKIGVNVIDVHHVPTPSTPQPPVDLSENDEPVRTVSTTPAVSLPPV